MLQWQAKIPDDVHQELCNWARYCWSGPWPHPLPPTECGSLEAGYRAPPAWDNLDERRTPNVRPNAVQARIMQAAWERLPVAERLVIREEYPASFQPRKALGHQAAANRLGISLGSYETLLAAAVKKLEAAFKCSTQEK